ncbi:tetratricopeptide repeat protein [Lysobacter terrae]
MYAPVLSAALAAAFALTNPAGDTLPTAPLTTAPVIVAPASLMAMPPELRERLHAEVLAQPATPSQRLQQLLHFMLDADALAIVYDEEATYSVEQTYAMRRANCLSFTLMFLALAREAGLDAQPQEIENTLSWRLDEGTIYRNNHVNVGVTVGGRIAVVDYSGDTMIATDRPVVIGEKRLFAHYYNNLAMAQLSEGNAVGGLQLMAAALAADPTYAPLWSNAGVLHVRLGDMASAERSYMKALSLDPAEDGALFNLVGLARRLGDTKRENDYRRRLARVQQRDPLHHFLLAMDAERNGDYPTAVAEYRQAIRLHSDEHRFWSALARTYLKAGDPRRAGKALVRAQALSDGATRAAYRAQLQELKRASN